MACLPAADVALASVTLLRATCLCAMLLCACWSSVSVLPADRCIPRHHVLVSQVAATEYLTVQACAHVLFRSQPGQPHVNMAAGFSPGTNDQAAVVSTLLLTQIF